MKKIALLLFVLLFAVVLNAQDENFEEQKVKKYSLNGYISQMNQTIIDSIDGNWINDGFINNRLKFNYFGIKNVTFNFQMRNRLIYGETVKYTPNYADYFENDRGFFDMAFNLADGNTFVLNSNIDRAFLQFDFGKFQATIGRQRINWGMTFVWNPNDLFNNYSFFDFDYAEKPGADAVDLQYFINYSSSIEFAAKLNSDTVLTTAMIYRFNLFNYDFQVLGGMLDEQDFVAGFAWSGNISQLTFRGEASYLHPKDNFKDTSGVFIASLGFDYMFQNSFMITAEFLYNQAVGDLEVANIFRIQDAPMSIKNLSFAKYNAVLQFSYPISPIVNTSMAVMWMSKDNWMFFSPNVSLAISQNVDFGIIAQVFTGKMMNPITLEKEQKLFTLAFLRLKYSF